MKNSINRITGDLLWKTGFAFDPNRDTVFNPYIPVEMEVGEVETLEDPLPFVLKSYTTKEGESFEFAVYMNWVNDFTSEWDLEAVEVDSEKLVAFQPWSKWDVYVLDEAGYNSDKRIHNYKLVRADIIAGLSYAKIADRHGKGLTWVKNYGSLVRRSFEFRRQQAAKKSR